MRQGDTSVENNTNDESITYDIIKPDHIKIMNLHVDHELRPYHLLINKRNSWLYTDPVIGEKRRQSIVKYLINRKEENFSSGFKKRERFSSVNNMQKLQRTENVARCNSLNDLYRCRMSRSDNGLTESRLPMSQRITTNFVNPKDEITSFTCNIIDHLNFQVNRRNERAHFVLSELLMQTIEFLFADELISRSSARSTTKTPLNPGAHYADSASIHNETVKSQSISSTQDTSWDYYNRAETIAVFMLDEIMMISPFITNSDRNKNHFPPSLQLLLRRLERNREYSSCDKQERPRPSETVPNPNFCDSAENLSEDTCEKIKTLLETSIAPLNISVGQYPIMGSDHSLPTYVATMSPPITNQLQILKIQDNKCPGCRHSFSPEMARRLRLCHYYGFYFCSVCHCNTLMMIPARILWNWDFSMLPVSCLARDLLKLIHSEPLFSIEHFSNKLRNSLRILVAVMRLRLQGQLLLTFIGTCRQGLHLKYTVSRFPAHWLAPSNRMFSLADFQLLESGTMIEELKSFASACIEHVAICPLCQAHGFRCELCENKADVIFPFEIDKVHRCLQCHACFHIRCHQKMKSSCPRCDRHRCRQEEIEKSVIVIN